MSFDITGKGKNKIVLIIPKERNYLVVEFEENSLLVILFRLMLLI